MGGPEVLQVSQVDIPTLKDDQVLVSIKAVGVNPVDTYIRSGTYARKPDLPYTPGADGAGVVEQVGPESSWKVGDRVFLAGSVSGTYAEKSVCQSSQLHALPENVSFDQGAAIFVPYATAYSSLFHVARALPGQSVLVHGASGGVGIAAVQLAKARGLRVLGTASSPEGLAMIEKFGGEGFNHRDADYQDKIVEATQGKGVDIILEMLANVNLAADMEKLVARFGRIVIIGNRGSIEVNPRHLMGKNSSVTGMALMNATSEEFVEIWAAIDAGLRNGSLSPVISSYSFSLDEAPAAHEHIIERPSGTVGKVVIRP